MNWSDLHVKTTKGVSPTGPLTLHLCALLKARGGMTMREIVAQCEQPQQIVSGTISDMVRRGILSRRKCEGCGQTGIYEFVRMPLPTGRPPA
jgi:DNA-binding MarR family transcriptional regulator